MRCSAATSFFTAQFFVGYYAIYHVDWLGWDLVEPITYSVGQGSFILGLVWILMNRGAGVEYSEWQDTQATKDERRWLKKYNFDMRHYKFLKNKLEAIDKQLADVEQQRFK